MFLFGVIIVNNNLLYFLNIIIQMLPNLTETSKLPKKTEYFLGISKFYYPNKKTLISLSASLMKRTSSPLENKIFEKFLDLNPYQGIHEYNVTLDIFNENEFSLSDEEGLYTGEGKLFGQPWKWDHWNSNITLVDGSFEITANYHLHSEGLEITKKITNAKEKTEFDCLTNASLITRTVFELMYSRLKPVTPSP